MASVLGAGLSPALIGAGFHQGATVGWVALRGLDNYLFRCLAIAVQLQTYYRSLGSSNIQDFLWCFLITVTGVLLAADWRHLRVPGA